MRLPRLAGLSWAVGTIWEAQPRPSVVAAQAVVADEIAELGHHAVEIQLHDPDRSVTLLGDMDLGDIVDSLAAFQPAGMALGEFLVALVLALLGLAALVVVLLAEDEHHHIGVLLDRA